MSRRLSVLRVVLLVDAVVVDLLGLDVSAHPTGVLAGVAVMVAWTAAATWAYADASRRRAPLLVADLALAVLLVALTPILKGAEFSATVPGFWVAGATLAWAMHYRWLGGLVAGAVVAVADLSARTGIDQVNTGNLFLLLVSGPIVGFMVESLVRMAEARDVAQREAAVASERARLARAVHDGVLQVLSLAQWRGAEPGAPVELAELGRVAGEQEAALRMLIREQDAVDPSAAAGTADLAAALLTLGGRPQVEVVTPGVVVPLPQATVRELTAAVTAILDNVGRHAGPRARAWVLIESEADRVVVTVRDDGSGIPAGRLEQAEAEGRLGVSQSIRGRLTDLGGTARLRSDADGTEWELIVPRESGDR